jgi:hypothetical protein
MKDKKMNAKKSPLPRRNVRLYTPNASTLEVFVDDVPTLRLDSIRVITLDDGVKQQEVKVA